MQILSNPCENVKNPVKPVNYLLSTLEGSEKGKIGEKWKYNT